MTEVAAPPADANGYWHYTYVTYHPDTGEWYGGKHSTNNLKDGYIGSGNWILAHPARQELNTEIIEFFYSEDHAYAAEAALVSLDVIDADPLCRNESDGGLGMSVRKVLALFADPEYRRKHYEGVIRRCANPEWLRKNRETNAWDSIKMAQLRADPEFQRKYREGIARREADPEYRQRVRETNAALAASPEWRQRLSEGVARRATDPEYQRIRREIGARNASNPEYRRKATEANRRLASDPVWRQKNRDVAARNAANPEWRRKMLEGIARRDAKRRQKHAEEVAVP